MNVQSSMCSVQCAQAEAERVFERRLGCSHIAHRTSPIADGFMLIELLMAMFILALGLSAVAAIFPVAGYLQKQTFNDAVGQQLERNIAAILKNVSIPNASLSSVPDQTGEVVAVSSVLNTGGELPLAIRCYPTADPLGSDTTWIKRDLYWVPLFQDSDTGAGTSHYVKYVFILAKQANANYGTSGVNNADPTEVPKVVEAAVSSVSNNSFNCSANLQVGDKILFNNGMTATVTDVSGNSITVDSTIVNNIGTPNKLWYAPPASAGQSSPTVAIKVVG